MKLLLKIKQWLEHHTELLLIVATVMLVIVTWLWLRK
jgi:hypothetical protein